MIICPTKQSIHIPINKPCLRMWHPNFPHQIFTSSHKKHNNIFTMVLPANLLWHFGTCHAHNPLHISCVQIFFLSHRNHNIRPSYRSPRKKTGDKMRIMGHVTHFSFEEGIDLTVYFLHVFHNIRILLLHAAFVRFNILLQLLSNCALILLYFTSTTN